MASTNLMYSRLGGSDVTFQSMIERFGVVTVMNVDVYDTSKFNLNDTTDAEHPAWIGLQADEIGQQIIAAASTAKICHLDTLKISNMSQEGPTKTVTGGQYSNPLIKFGKSARLEMQDALGNAAALDALCGTVSESKGNDANFGAKYSTDSNGVYALHVTEDFNGPRTLIGDTFFIDQKSGQQVKAKILIYQFLPDSIFNLTQDSEGDATVFDMNGDLLTTDILVSTKDGNGTNAVVHGVFYSIIDPKTLVTE